MTQSASMGRNPLLPPDICIPDGEAHVFGDRLYVYGSRDLLSDGYCGEEYCVVSTPGYAALGHPWEKSLQQGCPLGSGKREEGISGCGFYYAGAQSLLSKYAEKFWLEH